MIANHRDTRRSAREAIKQQRQRLSNDFRRHAAAKIDAQLQQHPAFLSAKHIGTYWPTAGEVDVSRIATRQNQIQYLPILQESVRPWAGKGLLFANKAQPTLPNQFGIPEPTGADFISAAELDYILVPLVGFDRAGNRLGQGGGYYDRAMKHLTRTFKLGVAYAFQELEEMEVQRWDVPLDGIVTEEEWILF